MRCAGFVLEAAKEDVAAVRHQTAGQVTTVYPQALRPRETALLYRDKLIPFAHQASEVMLVAYQSGKADFTNLITALRSKAMRDRPTCKRRINCASASRG